MNRRQLARWVTIQYVASWLLALLVLGAIYFFVLGRPPDGGVLLVAAIALFVVTPLLYSLARRQEKQDHQD